MSKMYRFLAVLPTLMLTSLLMAQNNNDAAASCAACGGCGVGIAIIVVSIGIAIFLAIWVAKDAKARGMDNVALWVILCIFLGLIGLVIYLLARPKGNLTQCSSCQGKRLEGSAKCPQCGNA